MPNVLSYWVNEYDLFSEVLNNRKTKTSIIIHKMVALLNLILEKNYWYWYGMWFSDQDFLYNLTKRQQWLMILSEDAEWEKILGMNISSIPWEYKSLKSLLQQNSENIKFKLLMLTNIIASDMLIRQYMNWEVPIIFKNMDIEVELYPLNILDLSLIFHNLNIWPSDKLCFINRFLYYLEQSTIIGNPLYYNKLLKQIDKYFIIIFDQCLLEFDKFIDDIILELEIEFIQNSEDQIRAYLKTNYIWYIISNYIPKLFKYDFDNIPDYLLNKLLYRLAIKIEVNIEVFINFSFQLFDDESKKYELTETQKIELVFRLYQLTKSTICSKIIFNILENYSWMLVRALEEIDKLEIIEKFKILKLFNYIIRDSKLLSSLIFNKINQLNSEVIEYLDSISDLNILDMLDRYISLFSVMVAWTSPYLLLQQHSYAFVESNILKKLDYINNVDLIIYVQKLFVLVNCQDECFIRTRLINWVNDIRKRLRNFKVIKKNYNCS